MDEILEGMNDEHKTLNTCMYEILQSVKKMYTKFKMAAILEKLRFEVSDYACKQCNAWKLEDKMSTKYVRTIFPADGSVSVSV